MEPTFRQSEVFPLIAKLIIQAPADNGYVRHEQIVSAVLSDINGAAMVAAALPTSKWQTDRQAASNMVAWFSQQITVGESPWAQFFDRTKQNGSWSYRPKTAAPAPIAHDIETLAIEGEPRLFFHLRRERDPQLRKAKIAAEQSAGNPPSCESCGFVTEQAFPGLTEDVLEVHHRIPLSEVEGTVLTGLKDLALLCPNCHRGIHRTKPMLSVERFREEVLQKA